MGQHRPQTAAASSRHVSAGAPVIKARFSVRESVKATKRWRATCQHNPCTLIHSLVHFAALPHRVALLLQPACLPDEEETCGASCALSRALPLVRTPDKSVSRSVRPNHWQSTPQDHHYTTNHHWINLPPRSEPVQATCTALGTLGKHTVGPIWIRYACDHTTRWRSIHRPNEYTCSKACLHCGSPLPAQQCSLLAECF